MGLEGTNDGESMLGAHLGKVRGRSGSGWSPVSFACVWIRHSYTTLQYRRWGSGNQINENNGK